MSNLEVEATIAIRAQVLHADPDTCKFTLSRTVHPGGPYFFDSAERAAGSPLVEHLFALHGVVHVLVTENVVTVGKAPEASWSGITSAIGSVIRTQLVTGVPAILESSHHVRTGRRPDAQLRAVVQELLDKEVNRSIAAHGGQISVVDVRDGNLFITMSGGCQGCAASQVTLRKGLEVMVRGVAPEISDIFDTTDHASGKKPFYERVG